VNSNFEIIQITNLVRHLNETGLRPDAIRSFNQAYRRGRRGQLLAKILRKENHLKSLHSQPLSPDTSTNHIVMVPIRQIKGSLNRSKDFDAQFNPLHERIRERWVSILTAIRSNIPLPPVELVQIGDAYYVQDGHHRISVARALEQEAIEACVVN
jgi:hypothetical protein